VDANGLATGRQLNLPSRDFVGTRASMEVSESSVKVVRHTSRLWNAVENIQPFRSSVSLDTASRKRTIQQRRLKICFGTLKRADGRPTHFGTQSYWGLHFGACENTSLQCSDPPPSWEVYTPRSILPRPRRSGKDTTLRPTVNFPQPRMGMPRDVQRPLMR